MKYSEVVQNIAAAILREKLVDGVLAFTQGLDASDIIPILITDEQDAEKITIASYQPCSLANLAREYGEKGKKLAVVVRACDARAIVELAKRKQLNLENLYLIGIECYGVAREPQGEIYIFPGEIELDGETKPLNEEILSPNCLRCEYPIATMADISCSIGKDGNRSATANTEKGERILSAAKIVSQGKSKDITPIKESALKQQEKEFGGLKRMESRKRLSYWLYQFDKCIKCYGCRNSCPICYCEDCYLEPERLLIKKEEYPPEKFFHITRLIHMGDSCVNCGQCEAACPMEIPVSKLFHMMSKELGLLFEYEAGLDVNSLPPMSTITEEDLNKGGVGLD